MEDLDLSKLIGRTVETVEAWPGCPCVLKLSDGYVIRVECLWRLLNDNRLVLTSEDDGQLFGRQVPVHAIAELSDAITSTRVTHVALVASTGDLLFQFGGAELQILSDSSGYEAWQLEGPGGLLAVAQGGGDVAIWLENA